MNSFLPQNYLLVDRETKIFVLLSFLIISLFASALLSAQYVSSVDLDWFNFDSFNQLPSQKRVLLESIMNKKLIFVLFSIKRELSIILMFACFGVCTKILSPRTSLGRSVQIGSYIFPLSTLFLLEAVASSFVSDGSESKFLQNNVFALSDFTTFTTSPALARVLYEVDLATIVIVLSYVYILRSNRYDYVRSILMPMISFGLYFSVKYISNVI